MPVSYTHLDCTEIFRIYRKFIKLENTNETYEVSLLLSKMILLYNSLKTVGLEHLTPTTLTWYVIHVQIFVLGVSQLWDWNTAVKELPNNLLVNDSKRERDRGWTEVVYLCIQLKSSAALRNLPSSYCSLLLNSLALSSLLSPPLYPSHLFFLSFRLYFYLLFSALSIFYLFLRLSF